MRKFQRVRGISVNLRWLRIDGGQELNASPVILGVKEGDEELTLPAGLDPGAVNPATGEETTAPSGTFPDGYGYASLITDNLYRRVLVRITGGGVLAGWRYWATGPITIPAVDDSETYTVWIADNV